MRSSERCGPVGAGATPNRHRSLPLPRAVLRGGRAGSFRSQRSSRADRQSLGLGPSPGGNSSAALVHQGRTRSGDPGHFRGRNGGGNLRVLHLARPRLAASVARDWSRPITRGHRSGRAHDLLESGGELRSHVSGWRSLGVRDSRPQGTAHCPTGRVYHDRDSRDQRTDRFASPTGTESMNGSRQEGRGGDDRDGTSRSW